jgi:hypothetical protein
MKTPNYYTPGQAKRKRKITREWFERIICKAFTDTEIIEKLRNVPDKDFLQIVTTYLPKETRIDSNTSVTLIVKGLEAKAVQGSEVIQALEPHQDDAE